MFEFMLDTAAKIREVPYETISDKLAVGGEVTLRGMATVFAVLILIWGVVEFLHVLLGEKSKSAEVKSETVSPPAETKIDVAPAVQVAEPQTTDDYAIIAVITAAVSAATGSSPNSFRVVSFKRANNKFSSGK